MHKQESPLLSIYPYFLVSHVSDMAFTDINPVNFHYHDTGEIMFVTKGDSLITCEERITHISAPFIAHYPACMPHHQNNSASSVYERWCFPLSPSYIGSSVDLPGDFFAIPLSDAQFRCFSSIIELLSFFFGYPANTKWPQPESVRDFSPQDTLRLKYLLLLFLSELKPLIPEAQTNKSGYINDVCLYITEHAELNLSLDSLAERFFVGRTTLTRDFRRAMDMSVVDFITTVRINRVKELLLTHMPLSEIAERCGFSSASYMIKVFIRYSGMTPKEYRRAIEHASD